MTENCRQVLEMLSAGQITPDETDRLIAALADRSLVATQGDRSEPRWTTSPTYRPVLTDIDEDRDGPIKVNVRVPLRLLRAGAKLASLIPPQAQDDVNDALRVQGVPSTSARSSPRTWTS